MFDFELFDFGQDKIGRLILSQGFPVFGPLGFSFGRLFSSLTKINNSKSFNLNHLLFKSDLESKSCFVLTSGESNRIKHLLTLRLIQLMIVKNAILVIFKNQNVVFCRWEQERVRQEHLALERWRQEAREHEKQVKMVKTGLTGFSFKKLF